MVSFGAGVSTGASMGAAVGGAAGAVAGAAVGAVVSVMSGGVPAMIRCTDPRALGLCVFDFNPESIQFNRSSQGGNLPSANGGSSGYLLTQANPPTIDLKEVVFTGETTKLRVDQLTSWCGPPAGLFTQLAALAGITDTAPPVCTFQWGPPLLGFMYAVVIKTVNTTYTRFHPSGIPVRATLTISMQVQPSLLGSFPTNPTSGGLPGRTTHMIRSGESLQSVAHQHYGRPGLWRKIAEINGITDPHRVRAGTTVFLPSETELVS